MHAGPSDTKGSQEPGGLVSLRAALLVLNPDDTAEFISCLSRRDAIFMLFRRTNSVAVCGELINSEGHIKSKSLRETHAGQEAGLAQPPTGTASIPACIA